MARTCAFKVTAKDEDNTTVAEYIFDLMKEAILFEKGMKEQGYQVETERLWIT